MARNPVVLITGASKGLGLAATTILLAEFHANVIALSRTETPELADLRNAHQNALIIVKGDVTDETVVSEAVTTALKAFQHIDSLILNAGILDPLGRVDAPDIPLAAWKSHFDVNFFSLITALRATLPSLRGSDLGGRVVFVSSGSATKGTPSMGPYNASKAAMNSLCRTLAEEEPSVTCVAMRPGTVDTQMQTQLRAGADTLEDKVHKMFIGLHEDKKLIKPEQSGYVIAALAVKASSSMSGKFVSYDAEECKDFRK